jgi:hypothetical protein
MKVSRWLILAAALLAGSCAMAPRQQESLAAPPGALLVPPAGECRIGPQDGPVVLAERGLGGTGMPAPAAQQPGGAKTAPPPGQDRGLGGTGATAGIAGVITGFASICVNGVEVRYDDATFMHADGVASGQDMLRAGQVVAISATRLPGGLQAEQVEIRHEVIGPVWAITPQGLIVAGQRVRLARNTRGNVGKGVGGWLAVSGLRDMGGEIVATRLDPVPPGRIVLHGTLRGEGGRYHIGALTLRLPPGAERFAGESVTVTGTLTDGVLIVTSITPDLLYSDPRAYFGSGADWFLLESFAIHADGMVQLAGGLRAPAAAAPAGMGQGPAIFSFTSGANGTLDLQGGWAPSNAAPETGGGMNGPGASSFGANPMQMNPGQGGVPTMPGATPTPGVGGFGGVGGGVGNGMGGGMGSGVDGGIGGSMGAAPGMGAAPAMGGGMGAGPGMGGMGAPH